MTMKEAVRTLWAKTRIMAWPGDYMLVSLPPGALATAATLMTATAGRFATVVVEKKEVASYLMKTFAEFEDDNPGNLKGIKAGGKIIPIRSPTG